MGINSAKSWFLVDRRDKLVFFTDYINFKKEHPVVFFILYSIKYVEMTGIEIIIKKRLRCSAETNKTNISSKYLR